MEFATWRWGFGFFALQAFALSLWIYLRREPSGASRSDQSTTFPIRRLLLLSVAILLVASAGVKVEILRTGLLIALGLAGLALFLWLDARARKDRLLPLRPLDIRRPTGAALVMILCLSVATIAITAFGPLLITAVHGASALTAGYIIACSSIGWTITAVLVSGLPERFDRHMISLGIFIVALSILGFPYAVPKGPIWLIAAVAALEGGGFGIAWTFILRRTTTLADKTEVERVSAAIPTIQRLGYALGAAYIGVVANASGLLAMQSPDDARQVAHHVFIACLPFAAAGLLAMVGLVRNRS